MYREFYMSGLNIRGKMNKQTTKDVKAGRKSLKKDLLEVAVLAKEDLIKKVITFRPFDFRNQMREQRTDCFKTPEDETRTRCK